MIKKDSTSCLTVEQQSGIENDYKSFFYKSQDGIKLYTIYLSKMPLKFCTYNMIICTEAQNYLKYKSTNADVTQG